MVLLAQRLYSAKLPTTFLAKHEEDGEWEEFTFDAEPIFGATCQIAKQMYQSELSELFQNIAQQSSIVRSAFDALSNILSVDVATLSISDLDDLDDVASPGMIGGLALIIIPADIYLSSDTGPQKSLDIYPSQDTSPQKSFWRRWFQ